MSDALTDEISTAVINVAKDRSTRQEVYILANGARARVRSVSPALIDEVISKIKAPEVPMVYIEDKGREEPNYLDPKYVAAIEEADRKRGQAAIQAAVLFGIELLDEIPNDGWWEKLKLIGIIDDNRNYEDLSNLERTVTYLKFVAAGNEDFQRIMRMSGVRQEDITAAEDSFRS